MSISQRLKAWQPGHANNPLPEPFEQHALRAFSVDRPMAEWGNPIWSITRNAYRAAVRQNALETLAITEWTLDEDDAAMKLTALALAFTFGAHEVGPELRAQVFDYCQSFITDLWPVVGRPAMTPGGMARNQADLRLMAARKVS